MICAVKMRTLIYALAPLVILMLWMAGYSWRKEDEKSKAEAAAQARAGQKPLPPYVFHFDNSPRKQMQQRMNSIRLDAIEEMNRAVRNEVRQSLERADFLNFGPESIIRKKPALQVTRETPEPEGKP